MIIEKTTVEGNRYDVNVKDYVAEGELTVTITLSEYRDLLKDSIENKQKAEKLDWLKQYQRANDAESRIAELEKEICDLRKKLVAAMERTEQTEQKGEE